MNPAGNQLKGKKLDAHMKKMRDARGGKHAQERRQQVLDLLAQGPLTRAEIAARLKLANPQRVSNVLTPLKDQGKIKKDGEFRWRLTTPAAEAEGEGVLIPPEMIPPPRPNKPRPPVARGNGLALSADGFDSKGKGAHAPSPREILAFKLISVVERILTGG
jgi:DNA-binding transcriptional ArsR family regulator